MTTAVFPIVLEAAARSLAAALAVWIALRLLRVRNVPAQKATWSLVLVAAFAMPFAMRSNWLPAAATIRIPALFRAGAAQLHPSPAHSAPAALPAASDQAADPVAVAPNRFPAPSIEQHAQSDSLATDPYNPNLDNPSPAPDNPAAPAAGPVPQSAAPAGRPWPIRPLALAWLVYLAVAAILLLRLLAGLAAALRIWFSATPAPGVSPVLNLSEPFTRRVAVRSSARVSSPVNIASGIVLPAGFRSWDPEKLRIVLAHECSHVSQGDFYLQLLAGLYAALFWFSPLGWWLKPKLSELAEAIGDRAGLEQAASPASYAGLLLEFASLPRPTLTGVAMARTGNLAPRIERLLNESIFRQAFAASRRRALAAFLVVPAALFASTALIRVQAAAETPAQAQPQAIPAPQTAQNQDQAQTPTPATGVSKPPQQPITDQMPPPPPPATPAQSPSPDAAPSPFPPSALDAAPAPQAVPAPPAPLPPGAFAIPPMPPVQVKIPPIPPVNVQIPPIPPMPNLGNLDAQIDQAMRLQMDAMRSGIFRDYPDFDTGGDPWALVDQTDGGSSDTHVHGYFYGGSRAELDQARKIAHGPFFWFEHDGKSYIVEDPSILHEIASIEEPMEGLRSQMRALSKQQRDLGQQLRSQMRQERRAAIPKPDLTKQMAELNAAVDSLKSAQGNTVTQQQLMQVQRRIAEIQGQLARLESGFYVDNGQWSADMSKFSEQEGKLGGEEGRLAGQLSSMAVANRGKIDAIINQTLKDGKARPVQ